MLEEHVAPQTVGADQIDALNDQAWHLFNSEPFEALKLSLRALTLADEEGYQRGLAYARLNLSASCFILSDNAQALQSGEQALHAFQQLEDQDGQLEALGILGAIYGTQNDYQAAVNYQLGALRLAEETGNKPALSKVLFNLGAVYALMEQYYTALDYQLRAVKIDQELNDQSHLASTLSSISELFMKLGQTQSALDYGHKALAAADINPDNRYVQAHVRRNLGSLYHLVQENMQALASFQASVEIFEELGNQAGLAETLLQIGNFYTDLEQWDDAKQNYERALELCQKSGAGDLLYQVHAALSTFYERQHQDAQALEHYKLFHKIKNEVLSSENQQVISAMQLRFDTERTEKEREIFRLRNIELAAANQEINALNEKLKIEYRLVKRELEIGRDIQASFLPLALPVVPGWEIDTFFKPAHDVSGDFYDAFELPNGRLGFVVADVCDKGVGAALFMALIRSLLRVLAQQATQGLPLHSPTRSKVLMELDELALPADIYEVLNSVELVSNYILENHSESDIFATLFFGVLDQKSGTIYYVNAGHEAPLHLGPKGLIGRLRRTGPPVGAIEGITYKMGQLQLEPGEVLLAYTDGVTEAHAANGNLLGEERLLALLEKGAPDLATPLSETLQQIYQLVQQHAAHTEPSDDITLLALRHL